MKLRARRLTLWIASLAILLAALGPGLSALTAVAGTSSAPWHEICTTAGLQLSATDDSAPSPLKTLAGKHCPWCTHHLGFTLPSAPADFVRSTPTRLVLLPPASPPVRGAPPHHPAAPRGPPVFS
jgi:hypothetical protein